MRKPRNKNRYNAVDYETRYIDLKIGYSYCKICNLAENVRIRNLEIIDDGTPINKKTIIDLLTGYPESVIQFQSESSDSNRGMVRSELILGDIKGPLVATKDFFYFNDNGCRYIRYREEPLFIDRDTPRDVDLTTSRPLIFAPGMYSSNYQVVFGKFKSIMDDPFVLPLGVKINPRFFLSNVMRHKEDTSIELCSFDYDCSYLMFGELRDISSDLWYGIIKYLNGCHCKIITVEHNKDFFECGKGSYLYKRCTFISKTLYGDVYEKWYRTGKLDIDMVNGVSKESELDSIGFNKDIVVSNKFELACVAGYVLSSHQVGQLSCMTSPLRKLLSAINRKSVVWDNWTLEEIEGNIYLRSEDMSGYVINVKDEISTIKFVPINGELEKVHEFINKTIELLMKLPFPVKSISFPLGDPYSGSMYNSGEPDNSKVINLRRG